MLQFFDVTRDAPWFPQVKALYESAFPANERIPIKHLLDDKIKREFWAFFNKDNGENAAAAGTAHKFCKSFANNTPTHASSSISKSKKIPRTRKNLNAEIVAATFTCATALAPPLSITSGKENTTGYFPLEAPSPKKNSATSGKKS